MADPTQLNQEDQKAYITAELKLGQLYQGVKSLFEPEAVNKREEYIASLPEGTKSKIIESMKNITEEQQAKAWDFMRDMHKNVDIQR